MRNQLVNSLWIGKLGLIETLCIRSFTSAEVEFHLWMYDPPTFSMDGLVVRDAREILDEKYTRRVIYNGNPSLAGFADLFRYKLLYEVGGVWVDMDNVLLAPSLPSNEYVFASVSGGAVLGRELNGDGNPEIDSWFIKAPQRSELMRKCFEFTYSGLDRSQPWATYGPVLLNKMVRECGLIQFATDNFMPVNWSHASRYLDDDDGFRNHFSKWEKNSVTAHLYAQIVRPLLFKRMMRPHEASVLATLLKKHSINWVSSV